MVAENHFYISKRDQNHSTGEPRHLLLKRKLLRSWHQLTRLRKSWMCFVMAVSILMLVSLILVKGFLCGTIKDGLCVEWNANPTQLDSHVHENTKDELAVNEKTDSVTNEPRKEEGDKVEEDRLAGYERNGKMKSLVITTKRPWTSKGPVNFPAADNQRQKAVVDAFLHAWKGYKKFAWGYDHLKPLSGGKENWFYLGLTIVDSLDTLYIMNLKDEFQEARDWVDTSLNLNQSNDVSFFETTIRVLAGLLSAYHFSADPIFLNKAKEVGDHLLPCFIKSPSGIPYAYVNLESRIPHSPGWSVESTVAEVTTVQLEFRDLSRSANLPIYEIYAEKASKIVHDQPKTDGLVPNLINPQTGTFNAWSEIKLGAGADSYYEYLLKQWIQTGKTKDYLRDDYLAAVDGIWKHLVRYTANNKWLFTGELKSGSRAFNPKMEHFVCYLPGTLALGVYHGLPKHHLDLAHGLLNTCYQMYAQQPTFLSPETAQFNTDNTNQPDMYVLPSDAHNLLRPEFVESLFYMYQITGNSTYQDWAWDIFQAFEKYTKCQNGYSSISNVLDPQHTNPRDIMESFFLGETLKYFYLIFSSDRWLLDPNKYVFNSECHPLPIYDS